ncbi:MAG: GNAT family N-acetyltransferase [Hyphomicrobiaceae bacterium]
MTARLGREMTLPHFSVAEEGRQAGNKSSGTIDLMPFTGQHLGAATRLSQAAGWPHRSEDWMLGLSVSEGVVALNEGRVAGTGLCSRFGEVATLNMIIVDKAMRGRGIGRLIMERLIDLAGERELRLVATRDGLPLYEKLGFRPEGLVLQHQGEVRAPDAGLAVEVAEGADIGDIAAMDREASGMERGALLARIAGDGTVLRTGGGFALLRRFGRGQVVGPVVASGEEPAQMLIAAAASRCHGSFLRIDLPESAGLCGFVEGLGLQRTGGGVAMIRNGRARALGRMRTFALVSQALG